MTINRRRHLHEVLETVRRCDDCISATYSWTSVFSYLVCRKIQQLIRDCLRMAPTSAETRRSIS